MKKIALVVQRCGKEVNGGSELHCLQYAEALSSHFEVEILTTCALDYLTWENHYPVGPEQIGNVLVRRFAVDYPRDMEMFNRLSAEIHANIHTVSEEEQENWLRAQGPVSSSLREYIRNSKNEYDKFIFFTYLYLPYFLLPLVREKAILVPTAHDEWPIYLGIWEKFFSLPAGFIFNTPEEKAFLKQRFPSVQFVGPVIGNGVERPVSVNPRRFRQQTGIEEPFLLYTGRIDESKGCGVLFDYFMELRNSESSPRKLVLIGKAAMEIPDHPDIVALGFVEEQLKWDAMSAADWLVNPSPHESLSLVLLEAWLLGTPSLVTSECDVLVGQSRRSNGGLWYEDCATFLGIIFQVGCLDRKLLGAQGREFVNSSYSWKIITKKIITQVSSF